MFPSQMETIKERVPRLQRPTTTDGKTSFKPANMGRILDQDIFKTVDSKVTLNMKANAD